MKVYCLKIFAKSLFCDLRDQATVAALHRVMLKVFLVCRKTFQLEKCLFGAYCSISALMKSFVENFKFSIKSFSATA